VYQVRSSPLTETSLSDFNSSQSPPTALSREATQDDTGAISVPETATKVQDEPTRLKIRLTTDPTKTDQTELFFEISQVAPNRGSGKAEIAGRWGTRCQTFACSKCTFTSKSSSVFQQHLSVHEASKPFRCTLCNYSASQEDHIERHFKYKHDQKEIQCDRCNFSCFSVGDLTNHIEARHATIATGGSHDQADAEWIVIRRQLRGHDDTPFGRPAPGRPSRAARGLAALRAYFVCFVTIN
jgi:hypothetical protein